MALTTTWFPGFIILAAISYYRITTDQLNLITGILFLLAVSSFVLFVAELAMNFFKVSIQGKNKIRLSLIATSVMILALEVSLRGLGKYSNYHEQNGNRNYASIYKNFTHSWFYLHEANGEIKWAKKEFVHVRKTSSLGLSEKQLNGKEKKEPLEYRVIALGDSFTEGVGTAYESTWVKVVDKELSAHLPEKKVTAINAGISGSDVYFEYVLLREKLLAFDPDVVIVAINNSDVPDIIIRGGAERFQSNGSLRIRRNGPNWEWVYGISYVFRHIMHDIFEYNWLLMTADDAAAEERKAVEKIRLCIGDFTKLAGERHFRILFVFVPHEYEIKADRYSGFFQDLVTDLERAKSENVIDLLDYYRVNKIITKVNSGEFFWSTDLHPNTKGYEAMGNAIAKKVVELQWLDRAKSH
jgi:lysophospholipase L1-like esterase